MSPLTITTVSTSVARLAGLSRQDHICAREGAENPPAGLTVGDKTSCPVSYPPASVLIMALDFDAIRREPTVENLPTPGALREWEYSWVPTLDGEPIESLRYSGFESRGRRGRRRSGG